MFFYAEKLNGAERDWRRAVSTSEQARWSSARGVITLQTLPCDESERASVVVNHAGFSLHVGVCAEAHQRDKLERLCRYISCPAISEQRLSLTAQGLDRCQLKTPY